MSFYKEVEKWTRRIPRGKVTSYGMIAALISTPRAAIIVGRALHTLMNVGVKLPWHRVINHEGYISTTCREHPATLQKRLLEKEGVRVVKKNGLWWIDLKRYLWQPQRY